MIITSTTLPQSVQGIKYKLKKGIVVYSEPSSAVGMNPIKYPPIGPIRIPKPSDIYANTGISIATMHKEMVGVLMEDIV